MPFIWKGNLLNLYVQLFVDQFIIARRQENIIVYILYI